jgi:hypothetical protein
VQPERARAVTLALDRADKLKSGKEKGSTALADQLDKVAADLEGDAGAATARDASRLRALAATIKRLRPA